jgi:hypothetical protein
MEFEYSILHNNELTRTNEYKHFQKRVHLLEICAARMDFKFEKFLKIHYKFLPGKNI